MRGLESNGHAQYHRRVEDRLECAGHASATAARSKQHVSRNDEPCCGKTAVRGLSRDTCERERQARHRPGDAFQVRVAAGGCDLTLPVTSRCCSAHPVQSIGSVISRHCKSNSHGTDLHEEYLEDRCVITRHVHGTRRRWSGARGTSAGRDPIHGHGSDRVPRRRGSDRGSRRRGSGRASRNRGSDLGPGRRSGSFSTGSTLPSRRDPLARRALPQPNASMVPNLRAATAAAGRALSPRRDAPRLALVAPGSGEALQDLAVRRGRPARVGWLRAAKCACASPAVG